MTELAEIFRRHGADYREKYAERMPFTHRQAMQAIEHCRTEALGGHVYHCHNCDEVQYSYHSCKNRHCPKCQNGAAEQFIHRFLQHVLPKGFIKVRYYGFFSSGNRHRLQLARRLLNICNSAGSEKIDDTKSAQSSQDLRCPKCGNDPDAQTKALPASLREVLMDSISAY